jgi:hypothetical protein
VVNEADPHAPEPAAAATPAAKGRLMLDDPVVRATLKVLATIAGVALVLLALAVLLFASGLTVVGVVVLLVLLVLAVGFVRWATR